MKLILFFFLIACCQTISAQPCTAEAMAAKTGKWKPGPQGSIRNIAAADLVKEKAFLVNLQKKISSVFTPIGMEVHYSTVWSKGSEPGYAADPYHLAMYFLRYLCDDSPKGYYVEYSSATNVVVAVNQLFGTDDIKAVPLEADHFRDYIRLFHKPVEKDGAVYMGAELTDNGRIKEENWLITRGDSLPFRYLTRKEYLLITKAKLEKQQAATDTYLKKYLDKVNTALQSTEKELLQVAVCNSADEERFTGFLPEGDRFAFYPVVPAMNYYKKGTARSGAQFISVKYKYSIGDPVFDKNLQSIRNVLTFDYLRSLLVK